MTDHELRDALACLPGWRAENGALRRRIRTEGFAPAFALATRIALLAERHDHHPELTVAWGRLDIALTTHSEGGITRSDLRLAEAISQWIPSSA